MLVEFLSDREVAAYGRYAGAPSSAELGRFFFLDDADKALIRRHWGDHHRLGFALQLTMVRFVATARMSCSPPRQRTARAGE